MTSIAVARARPIAPAAFAAAAAALIVFQQAFRGWEASWGAQLFGLLTPTTADPADAVLYFGLGERGGYGLRITAECSSAFLIAPVALVAAGVLLSRRVPVRTVVLAFVPAAALLAIGNQVRVGVIAWLIDGFGFEDGYRWGHTILGSLVSIVFIAIALVLFFWIVSRSSRAERERAEA